MLVSTRNLGGQAVRYAYREQRHFFPGSMLYGCYVPWLELLGTIITLEEEPRG